MKHVILFGLVILAAGGLVLGACNPPTIFSHTSTDWYRGLDLSQVQGMYFEMGSPMTNYEGCDPARNWSWAWADGLYLSGNWGGFGYTCVRGCPFPWTKPSSRMVVALASPGKAGTKFILDTVLYDDALGRYELDASRDVIHAAGNLAAPTVISSTDAVRGVSKAQIRIPIPRAGLHSDPGFNPKSLVAGIAVLGVFSPTPPVSQSTGDFQILRILPVHPSDFDNIAGTTLDTEVEMLGGGAGRAYFSYTLVINDGADTGLQFKPMLPFAAPIVGTRPGAEAHRSPGAADSGATVSEAVEGVMPPTVDYVTAYDDGATVEVEWRTSGDPAGYGFRLFRSDDRLAWEEVEGPSAPWGSVDGTTIYRVFNPSDGSRSATGMGAVYQIRVVDESSKETVSTVTTRARQR